MLDLAEIWDSPVDDRTKAIPGGAALPLRDIGRQGWRLLEGDMPLPAAVLRQSAIDHNVDWMRRFTGLTGMLLCPHGKTSMSPQLFDRQLRAGAWGITAATVSHLHVYRRFGIRRILLANQLVDPAGIRFILSELARDPDFDFYCLVDSVASVDILREAAAKSGCPRPIQLLVEVGQAGGRTGARSVEQAVEIARAVHDGGPHLALRGVEGFEGVLEVADPAETIVRIEKMLDDMSEVAARCDALGLFAAGPVIVSAGGSQFYDLPSSLRRRLGTEREAIFVLRSGCYVTHDSSWFSEYAKAIAQRMPEVGELGEGLRPAIEVWAYVQSLPEPGLAIVTMGKRDASFDVHMPTPLKWHRDGMAAPAPLAGHQVLRMNDQHAYVTLPEGSPLRVGDRIACGIAHPCTTFDRWPVMLVVDNDYRVVDAIRTFF
ncbi:D-serine dehydratase [Sphingopyxis panaciterrae]|uniref:amino acid deaminase n=1 Tax=Sphingopyxis panaciterrae TaxID=363841 RepID=UPI00141DA135|nr:amino acid deaminase [Sphingopyxis panaciterrae]NIJ38168.1 D-serine dehydratase [Sphingopyxis panaciterrae]